MACQMQNGGIPQEDSYQEIKRRGPKSYLKEAREAANEINEIHSKTLDDLEERKKEIEDALQKPSTEKMDAQPEAKDGKKMGKGNPKRRKTTKKKGKKEVV